MWVGIRVCCGGIIGKKMGVEICMALNEDKGRLTEDIIADELEYLRTRKKGDPPRELKYASGADLMHIFFDDKRDHSHPRLVHGLSYDEYSDRYEEYLHSENWEALATLIEKECTPELVASFKREKIRDELLS